MRAWLFIVLAACSDDDLPSTINIVLPALAASPDLVPTGRWRVVSSGTIVDLRAVAIGQGQARAVGTRGTVLVSTDAGASWNPETIGTKSDINAVAAYENWFLIAGSSGLVAARPGGWWDVATPVTVDLFGIADVNFGGAIDFAAVGRGATIATYHNKILPSEVGSSDDLFGMSTEDATIVGDHGTILVRSGSCAIGVWNPIVTGTVARLFGVTGSGRYGGDCLGGPGWAVGDAGTIVSFASDHGAEPVGRELRSPTSATLFAITGAGEGNFAGPLFAVGAHGTILAIDRTTDAITVEDSGTKVDLHGVAVGKDSVIAVGDHGTILRRD